MADSVGGLPHLALLDSPGSAPALLPLTMLGGLPMRKDPTGLYDYEVTAADLFCGAGGTSTGLVEAVEELEREHGIKVRLRLTAVNHWDVAIETHSANHTFAQHACSSLTGVDPQTVIPGPLDLLVASPECTHHSNARGGRPMSDQSRSSGDDVVRWIRLKRPGMVIIENVREYRSWGPLGKNGRPIKSRKGEFYQRFLQQIRDLGYTVEERLICCADNGDPTTRTRLFIYCRRQVGAPIAWPAPAYSKHPDELLVGGTQKWLTARDHVIDWSERGTSILMRRKMLSPNTWRRIFAGLRKFSSIDLEPWREELYAECAGKPVAPAPSAGAVRPEEAYVVKLYGTSGAAPSDAPLDTVTGQGGHLAVAMPAFLLGQQSPAAPRSVDEPAPTVAGAGAISHVEPSIIQYNGTADARSVDGPAGTVTGKDRFGLVEGDSFLVANFNERDGQKPRTHSVDGPAPTVTHRGAGDLVQTSFIITASHGVDDRTGNERRAHSADAPLGAVTGSSDYGCVQPDVLPFLSEFHSEKPGEPARVVPVTSPLPTQTAEPRFGLTQPEAFMLSAGGPVVGPRSVDEPAHTVLTRDHVGMAESVIIGAGGPSKSGEPQSVNEPLRTVLGENHKAIAEPHLITVNHGEKAGEDAAARVQSVDAPIAAVTSKIGQALVAPEPVIVPMPPKEDRRVVGARLVHYYDERLPGAPLRRAILIEFACGVKCLLDVLFRMLRPRELARAQSFPPGYKFSGTVSDIVKQIGNAVPVKTAKALCKCALLQLPPMEAHA